MRERNKERISIDTHNYFLNASIHYKHIVIVIKSNVVLNDKVRLKLILNLNEHLFYNATQFEKVKFLECNYFGLSYFNLLTKYFQSAIPMFSWAKTAKSFCRIEWRIATTRAQSTEIQLLL